MIVVKQTERSRFPADISMTRIPQITRDKIDTLRRQTGASEADIVRDALDKYLKKVKVEDSDDMERSK